jgi:hypothetical protein
MVSEQKLPKRVVAYIHDMGVKALDHLAEGYRPPAGDSAAAPNAIHTLIDHWKSMSKDDKEQFVDRVAESVVEVVAASAALPLGLKMGKKAAKATGKVIRKQTKKLRKEAKKTAKPKTSKPKTKAKK